MAKCSEEGCGKPQRIVYHGKPYCWECFDKQSDVSTKQEQATEPPPWMYSYGTRAWRAICAYTRNSV